MNTIDHFAQDINPDSARTEVERVNFAPQSWHSLPPSVAEVVAQIRPLFLPDRAYELRAVKVRGGPPLVVRHKNADGSYDASEIDSPIYSAVLAGSDLDGIAREVLRLSGQCQGIYYTVNSIGAARDTLTEGGAVAKIIARNRTGAGEAYLAGSGPHMRASLSTSCDDDVTHREWLPLDYDCPKAEGHERDAATDDERAVAWANLERALAGQRAAGWPEPMIQDSGNGFYLGYRLEPFRAVEGDDLIRRVMLAAGADTQCANPSRIMRLPGGLNCKGTSTTDRPHRRSEIIQHGSGEPVTREMLERYAAHIPSDTTATSTGGKSRGGKRGRNAATVGGSTSLTPDIDSIARRICERAEPATFGANGSPRLITAIRKVMTGLSLSPDDTASAIAAHYLPRCSGHPITVRELDHAVESVARRAPVMPVGCFLPGRDRRPWYQPARSGYDDITADEVKLFQATAPDPEPEPAPPAECPYAAAADVREMLPSHVCTSGPWHSAARGTVAGLVRVGCHDPHCTACRSQLVARVLATDLDWMLDKTDANRPDGAMRVDAMVIPVAKVNAAIRAAQRALAPYRWVQTVAGEDVQAALDAPFEAARDAAGDVLSLPVHVEQKPHAQEATTPRKPNVSVLFLTLRPADSTPISIQSYDSISPPTARVIRALGDALATVPPAPRKSRRRHTVWARSRERARVPAPWLHARDAVPQWGETLIKPPGDLVIGAPLVVTGREAASVVADLGWAVPFHTASERVQAVAVGYCGPSPAHTLMLRLLLTGAEYPRDGTRDRPDVDDIRDRAVRLADMMPRVGSGPAVESVLRGCLWSPPDPQDARARLGLTMELFDADARDRANVVPSTMLTAAVARRVPVDDFSTL